MKIPSRYLPTGQHFGGGQGVVSVWKDSLLQRDVAIKVLATRGIGGSLRREAALISAIRSKHVVEMFDFGVDPSTGKEYLVMEYVDGAELCSYRPRDVRGLFMVLYQIATGIADIHAAGCIHRDLKPENLKRDGAGIVKIIDFGIGGLNPINTNLGRGTDGYRAHEYFTSNPITLGPSADVYAFGVIAYEFCFGHIDPALLSTPPKAPPSFGSAVIGANAKLPRDVVVVLDRCLLESGRPQAAELKLVIGRHLLRNQHVADFIYGGTLYVVSQTSPSYRISTKLGQFQVTYNGLDFTLVTVTGEVFVNGASASSGTVLPGSCVITIGKGTGSDRAFIPFNVSHPEVVL